MTTTTTPLARGRRLPGRGLLAVLGVLALALALLAVGTALGPRSGTPEPGPAAAAPVAAAPSSITALQAELRRVPNNDQAWAGLGAAYVQQARLTADPTYYAKADGAFAQSLQLRPDGNDVALAGQASLAAARHQFAEAVRLAQAALAVNAYSGAALAVEVDGLNELGRYDDARTTLERLLQLHPGVDAFTRASYVSELAGDVDGARAALQRTLDVAQAPADRAFAEYYLGELAWNTGDLTGAARDYDAALAADPAYVAALTGRAKAEAQRGEVDRALADYRRAVQQQPQPATLVELGELLQAQGRTAEADQQYAVVRATQQLYAAQGQVVDAELSLFEADHGDPATAVALAQKALAARPDSVVAQDAAAWAFHAAGRDAEALPLAQAALRTGYHNATYRYHLGAVEAALGQRGPAKADLTTALTLDPAFNVLQAPKARALLAGLS